MGLYTKIGKQIDNYNEVISIDKSLSKQIFLKILVLLIFNFIVFVVIKKLFL